MTEEKYIQEETQFNADDPAQVNRARKKGKRLEIERSETLRGMMSVKDVRKIIKYWLDQGGMFGNPHIRGDSHDTAFNCGMSNLARMIWADIESAAPESCGLMLKEAKEDEKK